MGWDIVGNTGDLTELCNFLKYNFQSINVRLTLDLIGQCVVT